MEFIFQAPFLKQIKSMLFGRNGLRQMRLFMMLLALRTIARIAIITLVHGETESLRLSSTELAALPQSIPGLIIRKSGRSIFPQKTNCTLALSMAAFTDTRLVLGQEKVLEM